MRNDKPNIIVDKTIEFSLSIIKYCEKLDHNKKYVISKQLLRSATSIGANVLEAQNAESRVDFIHKMKIAAKEASETFYWLVLCEKSDGYEFDKKMKDDLEELSKILSKIISTSKRNASGVVRVFLSAFSNYQILKLTH